EAHLEHRRSQNRLDEYVARVARLEHAEQSVERKTMPRIQREQHAVVDRRRLDFEIEGLAQALWNRQTKSAIEADSERRVNDDLRAAQAVEEALDDDGLLVRDRAERLDAAADVVDGLRGGALRHRAFVHQPVGGRFITFDTAPNLAAKVANLRRQRIRAAPRLGLPERQRRRHPGRRLDHQAPARDTLNLPGHRAEREHVAARRFLREILFDIADLAALGLDHDVVVAGFGDRSARGDGREAGGSARADAGVDAIEENLWRRAHDFFRKLGRELFQKMTHFMGVEIAEVVGAAQHAQQLGFGDFLFLGGNCDDLLRRDIGASHRDFHFVEMPAANRAHRRAAFEQIVGGQREEASLGSRAEAVSRAADALNRGRDGFGRIELAYELDGADVDAEFERRGRDDRLQLAALEALLGEQALGAREAAMMRGGGVGAEPLLQIERDPLGKAAAERENQRRAMRADQARDFVVHRFPMRMSGQRSKLGAGRDDLEIHRADAIVGANYFYRTR